MLMIIVIISSPMHACQVPIPIFFSPTDMSFLKLRLIIFFSVPHSSHQVLKEFQHLLLKREHQV